MISENPLVTIICSCYNHEKYVIKALESVINQTYDAIQLIIVDDYSKDKSVHVITDWLDKSNLKEVIFIKNKRNLGLNKSFNNAYKQAKGKFIMDLAADDVLFANGILHLVNQFRQTTFENCGIVFGNTKFYDISQNFERDYLPTDKKPPTGMIAEAFQGNIFEFCSVTALYKKEVYDNLKGYDEKLLYEDLDFWIRATRLFEVDYTGSFIVKRMKTPTSLQDKFTKSFSFRNILLNYSTYLILKKAFHENNGNVLLNIALLRRINNGIKNIKKNYFLKIKYKILKYKIEKSIESDVSFF